ncbi:MAG: hypothetical protein QNI86_10255 [Halieaceae bacterium]|nr:hypothetical protein [Halieaceae bacterium]
MLSPDSYHTAWLAYGLATLAALVILYLWVGPRMSRGWRLALGLLLAALALTPAHPAPDVDTWAPAIFVTFFELLTSGAEAAARPLRSLLIAVGMALALCLLGWVASRLFLDSTRTSE